MEASAQYSWLMSSLNLEMGIKLSRIYADAIFIAAQRITRRFRPFKKGDKVWLEAKNLNLSTPYRKLQPKREGPFEIEEAISKWSYRLKIPARWRIHPVFHASLLTPYTETEVHGPSFSRPPPDLIDNQEEFEVEAIIAHRGKGAHR